MLPTVELKTHTHGLFVGLKATLNYMVRGVVGKEGRKKKVPFLPKKFYVNVRDILELFLFFFERGGGLILKFLNSGKMSFIIITQNV